MENTSQLRPVRLTQGSPNPQDEFITRELLNSCLKGDTYLCPRCTFTTNNPEAMISHLEYEINLSIQEVSSLALPDPKREQEI
jgi:hypothetical protein